MKNDLKARLIVLLILVSVSHNFNLQVLIWVVHAVSDAAAANTQGEETKFTSGGLTDVDATERTNRETRDTGTFARPPSTSSTLGAQW